MRNVPSLLSMLDDPANPQIVVVDPVMPWDYIRMRRLAAGMTIAQASRAFWHHPGHQADVERNMRQIEEVGIRVKRLWDMSRSFRLNPTVYRQLCDLPLDQQPRLCLACGWDEWSSQLDANGFDCAWSAFDHRICTLCEQVKRPLFEPRPAHPHPDNHCTGATRRAA